MANSRTPKPPTVVAALGGGDDILAGRWFLVGGIVTDLYGYLPAFLAAGGLEIAIAVLASRSVKRLAPERAHLSTGALEN